MSRAKAKDTEREYSVEPLEASRLNPLIDGICPSGTLNNCSGVTDFVAIAAASIEHSGSVIEGGAVYSILSAVSQALRYESERVQYRREGEPEPQAKAPPTAKKDAPKEDDPRVKALKAVEAYRDLRVRAGQLEKQARNDLRKLGRKKVNGSGQEVRQ